MRVEIAPYSADGPARFAAEQALLQPLLARWCEAFARLKQQLAAQFPDDREAYTQGKTGFVLRVLASGR